VVELGHHHVAAGRDHHVHLAGLLVGGLGIGGFGPVSEGMVMWAVGVVAIVAGAMWMGSRS